jgi:hypothetical protein
MQNLNLERKDVFSVIRLIFDSKTGREFLKRPHGTIEKLKNSPEVQNKLEELREKKELKKP